MNKTIQLTSEKPQLAILIDPENQDPSIAASLAENADRFGADYIFVGGSLIGTDITETVTAIKAKCTLPVILFPGHASHLCSMLDAILLLSLISGRNADYLIGNHVIAAPRIKQLGIPTISCGYILIESGKTTSVEYMSNTKPIPADKHDIVIATALAGEMMGNACIYLEGGSGAESKINHSLIEKVRKSISIPLIVGGGITSPDDLHKAYVAGANVAVIGTALEQDPDLIHDFCKIKMSF